jgi:iron complex outermembrane recepter protein
MKYTLSVLLIFFVALSSFGQAKKNGKVKRKYRNVEQVSKQLPPVFLRGEIYNSEKNPLAGASVTVDGTKKGVHTNENGEFFIENLQTGKARIRVSYIGYKIKTTDLILRAGQNYKKIMLAEENIHIEAVTVSSQKREQQLLDVPTAITAIGATTIEQSNITELGQLSEFVPGLYIREQGANRPSFVVRGLTSDEVSPSAQPRISVYMNNVPINRASSASVELFDMEQVEVLKGPQNTLFGRGAQAGAVHFISKKPNNTAGGYLTLGAGNFGQQEFRVAVNIPAIEDKLFIRAAGIYNTRNGYVENTFGGTLNGKNTLGGRFSVRFLPAYNHKVDLVLNYQKDDTPGIAFMSKTFPNTNGVSDVFSGTASLEQGENLGTGKDFFDATLNYKYYMNENTYWSTISSYRNSNASSRWDGDGTAAAALDMAEYAAAKQFYQEIRYNFSRNSRFNGSAGASYWWENADQNYAFSFNEQNTFHLFFDPSYLLMPNGQPIPVPALPNIPQLGPLAGIPLPTDHNEESYSVATNQAAEIFVDGTYQLTRKLFVSGGIRGVYDMYKLSNEVEINGSTPSTLGMLTGNYPNLFFKPSAKQEISKNTLSITGRAGLKYKLNDEANVFANYSRGRRPNVLQFTSTGEEEILDTEILNNFDAGFKASFLSKVFIDAVGFYQLYSDFQTSAWIADPASGEFNYIVKNGGKATSYGAEAGVKVAIFEQLDVFGNYAWLHATFDSTGVGGAEQEYAGNSFRLSPEHSFTFGFNARANITPNIQLFVSPSYSYKTHIYFEDANTEGIEQNAYGLLNINGGLELTEPNIILSVYGTNLLDEQYVSSGGNTGSLFGIPTFVPGAPRMFGAKLTWKF